MRSPTDRIRPDPDFFAQDRFHPSASGYRRWAQAVADRLERRAPDHRTD